MADFVFPLPEVGEFEAPNGLTYTHDGQKWRVKFLPGGAPIGKEGKPWLEISFFNAKYNNRTAWGPAWVYQPWWDCNSNCTYTWQYEVDINGDGDWIDIADHPRKDELGYFSDGETPANLILLDKSQQSKYPNSLIRFRLTGELNNFKSELSTIPVPAWRERSNTYDPPLYDDGAPAEPNFATEEYVDEQVATRLPLAGGSLSGTLNVNGASGDGKIHPLMCRPDGYYTAFGVTKESEVFAGSASSNPFMASQPIVITKGALDDALANFVPAWTPSAFMWEWGGNNDTREDPGTGSSKSATTTKPRSALAPRWLMVSGLGTSLSPVTPTQAIKTGSCCGMSKPLANGKLGSTA